MVYNVDDSWKFKSYRLCKMHVSSWHGLPFGFVDPLGGITIRWKGRWKEKENTPENIVQQPQDTNFTTARGLKQTMEWDLNDSFNNFKNGVFSLWENIPKHTKPLSPSDTCVSSLGHSLVLRSPQNCYPISSLGHKTVIPCGEWACIFHLKWMCSKCSVRGS